MRSRVASSHAWRSNLAWALPRAVRKSSRRRRLRQRPIRLPSQTPSASPHPLHLLTRLPLLRRRPQRLQRQTPAAAPPSAPVAEAGSSTTPAAAANRHFGRKDHHGPDGRARFRPRPRRTARPLPVRWPMELRSMVRSLFPRARELREPFAKPSRLARFKGEAILAIRLTSINIKGVPHNVSTDEYVVTQKGKGKRTAVMIGGGAGGGALIGGLAGGGKGALIGGLDWRGCRHCRRSLHRQQGTHHSGGIGGQFQDDFVDHPAPLCARRISARRSVSLQTEQGGLRASLCISGTEVNLVLEASHKWVLKGHDVTVCERLASAASYQGATFSRAGKAFVFDLPRGLKCVRDNDLSKLQRDSG